MMSPNIWNPQLAMPSKKHFSGALLLLNKEKIKAWRRQNHFRLLTDPVAHVVVS